MTLKFPGIRLDPETLKLRMIYDATEARRNTLVATLHLQPTNMQLVAKGQMLINELSCTMIELNKRLIVV